jgi:hypothetical protein
MDQKDAQILKLQGQLDHLKTQVITDDGFFTFPDGEFICGCGIRDKKAVRLSQENARLQDELNKSMQRYATAESSFKKAYEELAQENDRLRKRR